MNKIQKFLADHKIIDEDSVEQIYDSVRDRDDIVVLKCNKSGVIFLSTDSHMDLSHYEHKEEYYRAFNLKRTTEDSTRRYNTLFSQFINKKWLDIGTGAGGILDLIKPITSQTWSVEPQNKARTELVADGHNCLHTIADCMHTWIMSLVC